MTTPALARGLTAKRCTMCDRIYMPVRSLQKVCGPTCLDELVRRERAREQARLAKVRARYV